MDSRRDFLRSLGTVWAVRRPSPNLILIVTDDQRYDALGCARNAAIRTPAMDALATGAVRFTNAFVSTSVCSASRACTLTGRYGSVNGVMGLGGGLRPGEKTLVTYLKAAGYQMGFAGKWHLDHPATPAEAGFDFVTYFKANGPHHNRKVIEHGRERVATGFIEDYLVDQSIRFLESAAKKPAPFLLHLCTQVPHMNPSFDWDPKPETLAIYRQLEPPLPRNWQDDLTGKPPYLRTGRHRERGTAYGYQTPAGIRNHVRRYYASLTDLDHALGRLLAALDALRLRESTYILLMGDNGWMMGEHGFTSKVLPYEESIRVPLLVSGPGLKPGADRHLVLNADLAPTLLHLAGVAVPRNMHGRSLRPLLEGRRTAWRSAVLYEALKPELGSWPLVAVRTERWKYVQTFDLHQPGRLAFEELYDLSRDPGEMRNLASSPEHQTIQRALGDQLRELRASIQE
ncbi:MAG: sulfatase-like hydrolase/transferase [Acidobacteriota bacterium]